MKIARPSQALLAIVSPQLGPTTSAAILSIGRLRSLASEPWILSAVSVSIPETWIRIPPLPSFWTDASCPESCCATSWARVTETVLLWVVVKTAPPWNSMPRFRPRTARPTMAVMVIRIEMPYQILRLATKS